MLKLSDGFVKIRRFCICITFAFSMFKEYINTRIYCIVLSCEIFFAGWRSV